MRRSDVLALQRETWEKVGDLDLEVCVVPSAGTTLAGWRHSLLNDEQKLYICQSVFVDYRGYVDDDGKPIPNSLQSRLELINLAAVFYTVQNSVTVAQAEVLKGEADAASA